MKDFRNGMMQLPDARWFTAAAAHPFEAVAMIVSCECMAADPVDSTNCPTFALSFTKCGAEGGGGWLHLHLHVSALLFTFVFRV